LSRAPADGAPWLACPPRRSRYAACTQLGSDQQSDHDYEAYRDLVAEACSRNSVRCLAWCLMPNHVHLILVPHEPDSLRGVLADAHRRYSRRINFAKGWTGYLWQGRFASYPMDEAHLVTAIRYVELNPVKAKLIERAEDWRWSSARAHVRQKADGLTDLRALAGIHANWRAMLREELEAGEMIEAGARIEAHQRTGRPMGSASFVDRLERETGRRLKRQKPGPKPKQQTN
jgi:putative transposase